MNRPMTEADIFVARVLNARDKLPPGPVPLPGIQITLLDASLIDGFCDLTHKGRELIDRARKAGVL